MKKNKVATPLIKISIVFIMYIINNALCFIVHPQKNYFILVPTHDTARAMSC